MALRVLEVVGRPRPWAVSIMTRWGSLRFKEITPSLRWVFGKRWLRVVGGRLRWTWSAFHDGPPAAIDAPMTDGFADPKII